ncbi:hypothetical protein B566_EDAN008628 [Ephemera danica]|nr:hypothetical protein B566_EDAN008628 [Ephemera danica]
MQAVHGAAGEKLDPLSGKQRHQLKHRELFLSRQVETLPATHIRGKCSVTLLNETESLLSYLNKDDTFFYCLVFDPSQKTLLADKGEIRVGSRYQADATPLLKEGESDERRLEDLETLVWTPNHQLTDRQIDQFLVISRSVGTFARALDCSSSVKQPSLHMSAAAASRDITLFHAMDTLHKHVYSAADAISSLVPSTGPVLCRDEMEEWSASEANLFEEALEKYGKDFNDIRQDFLPWKTLKNIIEYYYMWKTTDRYVQQKRVKAVEAESKLKQVYIPNYNKPNPAVINNNKGIVNGNSNGDANIGGKACESCNVSISSQWYAWGPSQMHCKLCNTCWLYWKKYGGLKSPSRIGENEIEPKKKSSGSISDEERGGSGGLASHRPHRCSIINCGKEFKLKAHLARHYATAHGLAIRSGSPRPIMKTRTAFYLCSTPLTRISRRLCRSLLLPRHAARAPFWPINIGAVKQECQLQITGKSLAELRELTRYRKKERGSVTNIATALARGELIVPEWLAPTDKALIPRSEQISFPRPPRGPESSPPPYSEAQLNAMCRRKCHYRGCGLNVAKALKQGHKNFHMFRFKISSPELRNKWLVNCGVTHLASLPDKELRTRYICCLHFAEKDFRNSERKYLNHNAYPVPHDGISSDSQTLDVDVENSSPGDIDVSASEERQIIDIGEVKVVASDISVDLKAQSDDCRF